MKLGWGHGQKRLAPASKGIPAGRFSLTATLSPIPLPNPAYSSVKFPPRTGTGVNPSTAFAVLGYLGLFRIRAPFDPISLAVPRAVLP